ncbi:protein-L-isoaspartate(D-aspartate) O-methyltransferase [bacterium]|nr:protein-L-isoaspartate(D-aspartate) O-methyltransferase [candidate division CSSED10-310 bacterium]
MMETDETRFARQRETMVRDQIATRGIHSPSVLAAMGAVERHLFVPTVAQSMAYSDQPLAIGYGQTISQPYIVALMSELLAVTRTLTVLEIGTGSGYQAAVLAELGATVYSIEIVEPLAGEASTRLAELGYENVSVKAGDGFLGWPEHAPFDRIIITCAVPGIPEPLREQLAEHGRLVAPVEDAAGRQTLSVFVKVGGELKREDIIGVRFVPMTGSHVNDMNTEARIE